MSIIPVKYHKSWNSFMNKENIEKLREIEGKISDNFYPNKVDVLRFLSLDLKETKCIVVGMEPYPSSFVKDNKTIPEATGRSFEIKSLEHKTWQDKFKQSSLRNILKTIYYNETNEVKNLDEVRRKIKDDEFKVLNPHDWFNDLEQQGVLFLNATLTVKPGVVDSHTLIWKSFMEELFLYIQEKNKDVKWLLWGEKAQKRVIPTIKDKNNIVCSCHPRLNDFIKENCFKEVKDIEWTGNIK